VDGAPLQVSIPTEEALAGLRAARDAATPPGVGLLASSTLLLCVVLLRVIRCRVPVDCPRQRLSLCGRALVWASGGSV